jgi:hypothetical protein
VEREERAILTATGTFSLDLLVEESRVDELGLLMLEWGEQDFEVLYITRHAGYAENYDRACLHHRPRVSSVDPLPSVKSLPFPLESHVQS